MRTEEITLKVSSDSLVDEIVRLISDDELTNEYKKRIEQSLNIPDCDDPDISDFSNEDIHREWWENSLYTDLDADEIQTICNHFDIPYDGEGSTLRDEQYTEVLQQLKEKFSVAELEALVNSK